MRRIFLLVAIALGLLSSQARAWHAAGHELTALVAFEQLDDATRSKLVEIIKQHPRFKEEFKLPAGLSDADQQRWLFCQAAIWPDLVGHTDGTIPPDPKKKSSYARSNWHFINIPFCVLPPGSTPQQQKDLETRARAGLNLQADPPQMESLGMNGIQAIAMNAKVLNESTDQKAQAVAICWIMHVVGDIHQPLHSVALFSQTMFNPDNSETKEGDRGGNRIVYGSNIKTQNLHFLWDEAPMPGDNIPLEKIKQRTADLLADPDLKAAGQAAIAKTDPMDWAQESVDLDKTVVYTPDIVKQILQAESNGKQYNQKIIDLPANYETDAGKVASRRVVEGGFRLAEVLKKAMP